MVQFDFGNYMETLPESTSSPTQSVGATRKLMEEVARESVKALPNVTVRPGSWVSGLRLAEAHGRIQGKLQLLLSSPYVGPNMLAQHGHKVEPMTSIFSVQMSGQLYKLPQGPHY